MEISFLVARGHIDDYDAVMWDLEHKYDEIKDKWDAVGPASISVNNYLVYILLTVRRKETDGQDNSGQTDRDIQTDLPAS